jgi:hypothetical protein
VKEAGEEEEEGEAEVTHGRQPKSGRSMNLSGSWDSKGCFII